MRLNGWIAALLVLLAVGVAACAGNPAPVPPPVVAETVPEPDADSLAAVRAAGYTDANIADITVVITQKTLSNYFNHIHDTVLDLPPAPPLK